MTDENGSESLIKKDEVDRVVEQSLGCRTESMTTGKFAYDALGNKMSERMAGGIQRCLINYTYNGRTWLLTQAQTLDGKTYMTRFEYDGVGNKKFVYDNKGNKPEFIYSDINLDW